MKPLNIHFVDFWPNFNCKDNFFTRYLKFLLEKDCDIFVTNEINDCDVLFYSCFGDSHRLARRSKTKKIFYTGENVRPNFSHCDYSLTFDFDDYGGRNVRLPLWYLYVSWFGFIEKNNPAYTIDEKNLQGDWFNVKKEKKCCTVFSSPTEERIKMIGQLEKFFPVAGFGKFFGKHSKGEKDKYKIISQYRSSICFENSMCPGYVTEKLLHARTAGNVAIYWGHSSASYDFNPKGYINAADFKSFAECAEYVNYVIEDSNKLNKMIKCPIFSGNKFKFNDQIRKIIWK